LQTGPQALIVGDVELYKKMEAVCAVENKSCLVFQGHGLRFITLNHTFLLSVRPTVIMENVFKQTHQLKNPIICILNPPSDNHLALQICNLHVKLVTLD